MALRNASLLRLARRCNTSYRACGCSEVDVVYVSPTPLNLLPADSQLDSPVQQLAYEAAQLCRLPFQRLSKSGKPN